MKAGKRSVYIHCAQCKRPFKAYFSQIKGGRIFCTQACSAANLKAWQMHCASLRVKVEDLAA